MLRAALVVSLLAAAFIVFNALSPHSPEPMSADPEAVARAKPIVAAATRATANLALLGDKRILLHPQSDAFLMFQVAGRSWVAMGDPVGSASSKNHAADLAWEFRELADEHGGWTVFYQVTPEYLPLYIDIGLALLKLGEEARVPLPEFSLEGSRRAELRTARRRGQREGATFEVIAPPVDDALFASLAAISQDWLSSKSAHEKRFSVGYFDQQYLRNFPLAIVRVQDQPVAFANLWTAANRAELSIDLMRYSRAAPHTVMDFLMIETMLWGKSEAYQWFNLGMAPLSGLEQRPLAPVWHRLGNLVFDVGGHFYNFEGLRRYKEKFLPVWEPRYLAAPGGWALPRVLIDVMSLIAGGLREIVSK
jgi:phosphatidylglycerol lysyltransferase